MGRTIRFQIYSALPNLGIMASMLVIILGLNILTGGEGFFASYYTGLPMMFLFLSLVFGSNLSVSQLHVALSMGAGRRSYFWSAQVTVLTYTAVLTLFQVVAEKLPAFVSFAWKAPAFMWGIPWWLFALCCFVMMLAGVVIGFVISRSKMLGALLLGGVLLVSLSLFVALMFVEEGDMRWILAAILIAISVALEIVIQYNFRRAVVR